MLLTKLLFARAYFNDGAATGSTGTGSGATGTGAEGQGGQTPPPATGTQVKTFTQEQVNSILAAEKKKLEEKSNQAIKRLEELQQSTQLTQKEKESLAAQIEELRNQSLTKEQQLTRDLEKLREQAQNQSKELTTELETWKNRYGSAIVQQSITQAAVKHEAFRPEQLHALLAGRAKLVEDKDDNGDSKGTFTPVFKFEAIDPKTKKPVALDLSADEVMQRMKDTPELYGNLFKSGLTGGIGGGQGKTGTKTGEPDITKMSPEEYRQYRKDRGY